MKCINPLKHNPQFEGKQHCNQCELDAKNEDEKICQCSEQIPRHAGVHPQTCELCGGTIE